MDKQNKEDQTSQKGEEEETSQKPQDDKSNEGQDVSDPEALKDELGELKKKNEELFARAKKAEAKYKAADTYKRALEADVEVDNDSESNSSSESTVETSNDPLEQIKLMKTLQDYEDDEIEVIQRQAKALGTDLREAAKHEDTQLLIKAKREKKKKDKASPTPSSKQGATTQDLDNLTTDDIKEITSDPINNMEQISKIRENIIKKHSK